MHRFRQGGFNTLVSTCVGEEGLDIGEVDLIVCFDAQKNPIRLVQRMGRTGRKRQGRIVVILAEGREERVSVDPRTLKSQVCTLCSPKSRSEFTGPRRDPPNGPNQTYTLCVPQTYNQSQSNKRSVYKSITGNKSGFHLYPNSPRMLPQGINPSLHKMHITCGQFDHRESGRRSVRGRRSLLEGRASLIHPQNLSKCRGRSRFWPPSKKMELIFLDFVYV